MRETRKISWQTAGALLLALFPFCPTPYAQDSSPVHYVNVHNATPVAPFLTWATAANSIQDAILFANDGDTVLVRRGVYNERIDFMGKAIVVSSEEDRGVTIIDGNQSGSVVTFSGGEGTNSIIQGFTVTNGYAVQGGGIYCTNAAPVITNCVIAGNRTLGGDYLAGGNGGDGAGIYATSNSYPVITECVVSNNATGAANYLSVATNGGNGGGIFCDSGTIVRSLISGNSTGAGVNAWFSWGGNGGNGAGIYCHSVVIKECLIIANGTGTGGEGDQNGGSGGDGGGVYCGSATIVGSVIQSNATGGGGYTQYYRRGGRGGGGGGIYCCGSTVVEECTISANTTGGGGGSDEYTGSDGGDGGGIYAADGSLELLQCNIIGNSTGDGGEGADGSGGNGGGGAGLYASEACVPRISSCSFLTNVTGNGGVDDGYYGGGPGGGGGSGGAVVCFNAGISNSIFLGNETGNAGHSTPLYNKWFSGGPGGDGGGVYAVGDTTIRNCLFIGNITGNGGPNNQGGNGGRGGNGAGLWSLGAVAANCTIWGNTLGSGGSGGPLPYTPGAEGAGGGIWCTNGVVVNAILWNNAGLEIDGSNIQLAYSDVESGTGQPWFDAATCIDADPQFVNPLLGDWHLAQTSPCFNAGTNQAWMTAATDLDGNARISCSVVDMGAFESTNNQPYITQQPLSQALCAGGSWTFQVGASGDPAPSYQWRLNATNLSGATASSYLVSGATPAQAGPYDVVVSNPCGSMTSSIALLAVALPGPVVAWGANDYGQWNIPAGLSNVAVIAAGVYHSLALKTDGTVVAWGQNGFGQTSPPVDLSNVTAIAAGWGTSLALKRDGTLEEWGWDGGYGLKSTAESLSNITAIAACWDCLMGLNGDGSVTVWGKSRHGETNVPPGLTDVVAISGGGFQCLALQRGGTVVAWGDNEYGQNNVPAGLSNVMAIADGADHCLALKADGTVVAWGADASGQANVPAGLSNVVAISGGNSHSLALENDGTVVAWGDDSHGQTEIPANLTNVVAIAAGGYHNLALAGSGAPALTVQPVSRTATAGDAMTLVSMAVGQPTLTYQWRNVGVPLVGQTNSLLFFPQVQTNQAGSYDVVISNSFGGVQSRVAVLTVLVVPVISQQPLSQMVLVGDSVSFSVASQSILPVTYQWQLSGTNLPLATSSTLTLPAVSLGQAGSYTVVVTSQAGAVTSNPALLDVRALFASVNGSSLTGMNYTNVGPTTVSLFTGFTNGSVYYSLDGSPPTFAANYYRSSFTIMKSGLLRAGAYCADLSQYGQMPPIAFTIIPVYGINYLPSPGGSVSATPSNSTYAAGTVVNLQAAPKPGWNFLNWLGDCSGGNSNTTLTMDGNMIVQAVFGTTLGVTVTGNGAVTVDPVSASYPYGTTLRLTGQPAPGYSFDTWGNAAAGITANPLYFTITNGAPVVSTLFTPVTVGTVSLTVQTSGHGKVQVSPPANSYSLNASVTLTAVPDPGQQFIGWSGDAGGTTTNLSLTLNQSKTVIATFSHMPNLNADPPLNGLFNSGFRLLVTSDFGAVSILEGSTNLSDWETIGTFTNIYGTTQFTDPAATTNNATFYRLLLP